MARSSRPALAKAAPTASKTSITPLATRFEESEHCSCLCSDVRKLHDFAVIGKTSGLMAEYRAGELPIADQIEKALRGGDEDHHNGALPVTMLELFVRKISQAILSALEDTQDCFFFGGPSAVSLSASANSARRRVAPVSNVEPLDAVFTRLRWLHQHAKNGNANAAANVSTVAPQPLVAQVNEPSSNEKVSGSTSSRAVQTQDIVSRRSSEDALPAFPHCTTRAMQTDRAGLLMDNDSCTHGTQTHSSLLCVGTVGTQVTLIAPAETKSSDSATQTACVPSTSRHRGVQAEVFRETSKDVTTQTDATANERTNYASTVSRSIHRNRSSHARSCVDGTTLPADGLRSNSESVRSPLDSMPLPYKIMGSSWYYFDLNTIVLVLVADQFRFAYCMMATFFISTYFEFREGLFDLWNEVHKTIRRGALADKLLAMLHLEQGFGSFWSTTVTLYSLAFIAKTPRQMATQFLSLSLSAFNVGTFVFERLDLGLDAVEERQTTRPISRGDE